jgi:hypothetical protein
MRLTFTLYDVQEISTSAYHAFISTFRYQSESEESDSDFNSDNSDSDLSDLDLDMFGCGEITPEVESMVENSWEICSPIDQVYGATTSKLIKETVTTATEETQCAGLKLFKHITPGSDRSLIDTCTAICFWCCCETVKKVSPIIAEATNNLMY